MAVREKKQLPPVPDIYLLYQWRRLMHTTWNEAMETPVHVILQDMELSQLEATYNPDLRQD